MSNHIRTAIFQHKVTKIQDIEYTINLKVQAQIHHNVKKTDNVL